jgi:hypothetical protein
MSATNAPFGLRPAFHPSGLDRAQALSNGISSGYGTQILKGQPVAYSAGTGLIIPLTTNPAAGAAVAWSGAFVGVEWTDTTGRRRVSNYWPASTAYIAGSLIAYFYNDQNIVYEIQADGSMAQTTLGYEYNFTAVTSGSNTTGLSQATLGSATQATPASGQGQMRVVDLAPYVDNAWSDSYTVVRVVNCQSQFFGSVLSI